MRRHLAAAVLAATTLAGAAGANPLPVPRTIRAQVAAAVAEVLPAGCGGVLVGDGRLVATALHCVRGGDVDALRVRFADGVLRPARLAAVDRIADQVVLRLASPARAAPLVVARRPPIVGTVLYFAGNPDRPRWQDSRLDRIGTCPSLPDLPDALFTSIHGVPGDSGSPLVDGAAQVVGLVHGGAQCHIATPGTRLAPLVERALAAARAERGTT